MEREEGGGGGDTKGEEKEERYRNIQELQPHYNRYFFF